MSRLPSPPIVCDVCGKQRQENNHWWSVFRYKPTVFWELRITPCDGKEAEADSYWLQHDFCGQDCALKFISEQMGKMSQ